MRGVSSGGARATRRAFCLGTACAALGGCRLFEGGEGGGGEYAVAVLGDTHYDAEPESVYHSHYDESNKWAAIQHSEFRRNGEMWRERCPRLLAASAELARAMKTDFVLQMGDIIQGDCDDPPTHARMLRDCMEMLRRPYPKGLPFLTVMGNHDFRGKGARKAYMEFAEPHMSAETAAAARASARKPVSYPAFSFWRGDDLWVFCDFETTDLSPVIDCIERGADARHTFLVTHGPFTTPDAPSFDWRLGGRAQCSALRPGLYELLSRRRAVVLSGHTHTTTWFLHKNRFGSFCEFTSNSVWAKAELATGEAIHRTPEKYGSLTLPKLDEERAGKFRAHLDFFRPGLKGYFFSKAAGHCRLDVSDSSVRMSFYPGDARTAACSFPLKV